MIGMFAIVKALPDRGIDSFAACTSMAITDSEFSLRVCSVAHVYREIE